MLALLRTPFKIIPTPPVMALVLRPFVSTEFRPEIGMTAWLVFKVGLTLVALHWLVLRQREAWGAKLPDLVPVLALLATATPIIADLTHGNINLWILFLVVAAWILLKVVIGVLAGLATVIVVVLAIFGIVWALNKF